MDVVCLRCGREHRLAQPAWRCLQESECPRCGYLGWTAAEPAAVTQRLVERRVHEPRRLRLVG
jgi:hypothetical protein